MHADDADAAVGVCHGDQWGGQVARRDPSGLALEPLVLGHLREGAFEQVRGQSERSIDNG